MAAAARQSRVDIPGLQVAPRELGDLALEGEAAAGTELDVVVFALDLEIHAARALLHQPDRQAVEERNPRCIRTRHILARRIQRRAHQQVAAPFHPVQQAFGVGGRERARIVEQQQRVRGRERIVVQQQALARVDLHAIGFQRLRQRVQRVVGGFAGGRQVQRLLDPVERVPEPRHQQHQHQGDHQHGHTHQPAVATRRGHDAHP